MAKRESKHARKITKEHFHPAARQLTRENYITQKKKKKKKKNPPVQKKLKSPKEDVVVPYLHLIIFRKAHEVAALHG